MQPPRERTRIRILDRIPIFRGIPDPFTAVEIHGWAVAHAGEIYDVIARSSYVQAMKHPQRMSYGEQFHGEIHASHNQGTPYLVHFLEMALRRAHGD